MLDEHEPGAHRFEELIAALIAAVSSQYQEHAMRVAQACYQYRQSLHPLDHPRQYAASVHDTTEEHTNGSEVLYIPEHLIGRIRVESGNALMRNVLEPVRTSARCRSRRSDSVYVFRGSSSWPGVLDIFSKLVRHRCDD